jgi:hypothetical protein
VPVLLTKIAGLDSGTQLLELANQEFRHTEDIRTVRRITTYTIAPF